MFSSNLIQIDTLDTEIKKFTSQWYVSEMLVVNFEKIELSVFHGMDPKFVIHFQRFK